MNLFFKKLIGFFRPLAVLDSFATHGVIDTISRAWHRRKYTVLFWSLFWVFYLFLFIKRIV